MMETVSSAKRVPRGLLKISTSFGLGRKVVSPLLSRFASEHPELKIQLELVDRQIDLVNEGIDLDIRVGAGHEPHLFSKRILPSQRVLCASPAYLKKHGAPADLAALRQHQCLVIRERNQSFGIWRMMGPKGQETVKVSGGWPPTTARSSTSGRWMVTASSCVRSGTWPTASSAAGWCGCCRSISRRPTCARSIPCS
jgi:LysR family transcriptional activator of dmlA